MSHIEPFTIDEYTFTHTETDADLDVEARDRWRDLSEVAVRKWTGEQWDRCTINESNLAFAMHDSSGAFFGTWVLYRARPVGDDPHVVSALPGPMFPGIDARVPDPAYGPTDDLINGAEMDAAEIESAKFWRRMFSIMEWLLVNPLTFEDGDTLIVDHWRFPSAADGDPLQHEWQSKMRLDQYCKAIVEFSAGGIPQRTSGWKATDPDPSRARGSVNP